MNTIEIATDDGVAPACVFGDGAAAAPAVIVFIDAIGMRPAMHALGERLAAEGYRVLMPDLLYRIGAYTAPTPAALFADAALRTEWFGKTMKACSAANVMRDLRAYLGFFGEAKVGVTGYCMGGRLALIAAGTYPERVAAAAAYHPGNLFTDTADSAHRMIERAAGPVYVGAASEDPSFTDEQRARFDAVLTAAGVDHAVELYPAKHGWVPSDTPVHDAAATARHWDTLLALLARTLP